jgi:replicative DNA helicase
MSICYSGDIAFDDSTILNYMKKSDIANPENLLLEVMAQKQVPQSIVLEHISTLKEAYRMRMLRLLQLEIAAKLEDGSSSSDVLTQMIQNAIDGHLNLANGSSTRTLAEVRAERKSKPPVQRLETKIPFIDTVLTDKHGNSGFRNEGLVFVSGLKQSGKTFIITRIIENVSREHHVMFGSLEFGEELYDENIEDQQEDGHFDGDIEKIHTFDSIYEVDAICAEVRLQHKLYGVKLVVLDSMMRITNNNPMLKTDERRISEMFSKLGKLSKELKIPIIIVVQSSKEDLKSSMISVKGSMNADHEAYVWFHLTKTNSKNQDCEMRTIIWNKNKDTHKHPKQHLMFVPQTSDFYRVEVDEHGNAAKALDKFRRPPAKMVEIVYENIKTPSVEEADDFSMPEF